jgi:hypothetical protein
MSDPGRLTSHDDKIFGLAAGPYPSYYLAAFLAALF